MKYIVEVAGRRLEVEIDGSRVLVDGAEIEATLDGVEGSPVRLLRMDGAIHRVLSRRDGARGNYQLDLDGQPFHVEALDERTRAIRDLTAANQAAAGPAPLLAPMPGLVVRIMVAVGDAVSAGQPLVVVEAMKMENELRAAGDARVTAIRAEAGTAVEKGATLVELESL